MLLAFYFLGVHLDTGFIFLNGILNSPIPEAQNGGPVSLMFPSIIQLLLSGFVKHCQTPAEGKDSLTNFILWDVGLYWLHNGKALRKLSPECC